MNKMIITTLAASVFVGLPAHAQNQILNGSFESPSIPANTVSVSTPASWLGNSFIVNGDYSPGYPLPQVGQQYVGLGNSSFVSQAFTIGSPGTYVLSWYDSTEYNFPNFSPYSVTVTDSLANTVASANLDADAHALRLWTQRSIAMTLAPDTYTLRFQGNVAMFGESSLIDNVSLVPEPTTLSLLFVAGLMLIGQRRLCYRDAA